MADLPKGTCVLTNRFPFLKNQGVVCRRIQSARDGAEQYCVIFENAGGLSCSVFDRHHLKCADGSSTEEGCPDCPDEWAVSIDDCNDLRSDECSFKDE